MTRARPLRFDVAELLRRPGTRLDVERAVVLEPLEVAGAATPPGAEVSVELLLESIPSGITVTGSVQVPWTGRCRRCLREVASVETVALQEVFEVHHTEDETFPIRGTEVDLEPVVREAALLALPLAPLCDPGCRGPAPERFPAREAGELEADDAAQRPRDPRWAALDRLVSEQPDQG